MISRTMLGGLATLAGTLAMASPAGAIYAAQFADQCCYLTVEPGDRFEQYLAFRNTGDQVWYRDGAIPVRLGASNPIDRPSPFFTPDDWISAGRPTGLDSASTAPGEIGRFTWVATAPQALGSYTEFYAPLAESVTWMEPTAAIYLEYDVIAAQAPVLRITAAPARVARGVAIDVSADVTDNRGVARVTFAVGGQVVTATKPSVGTSGYTATLSSSELAAGTQSVQVRAFDLGGRESSALSSMEVYEPPAPPPPPVVSTRLGAFTPLFATRAGRGGRLGTLNGLGAVAGLRPGTRVRMVCTRGCTKRLSATRKANARGKLKLTLTRPQRLLRTTRIELQADLPGYVTRFQRYRFRRTRQGTTARFVSAGCLISKKPRMVIRCPTS